MNAATEAAAAPAPATSSAGAVATGEPEAAAVAEGQEVKEVHKIKTDGVAAAQRAHRDRPFFAHTQEALKETLLMKVKTESGNKNYCLLYAYKVASKQTPVEMQKTRCAP